MLKFVIFFGIGLFFIYWFLLKLDREQKAAIWQSFVEADYGWIGLLIICTLSSHLVRALRWRLLYHPIGYRPSIANTFGSVMVAYLANLAFPRLGEVVRCATMHTSEQIPIEKSLGTVVTERLIDVLAFGLVVVLGLLIMFRQAKDWLYDALSAKFDTLPSAATLLTTGVVLIVLVIVGYKVCHKFLMRFSLIQKIDKLLHGCIDGVKSILHLGASSTCLFITYSVLLYFLYILGGLIVLQALPETAGLGIGAAFVIYLFGSVGMMISQGGLGAYPVLVWQALTLYGISQEVSLATGWLLWGAQQAVVVVVGLIFFAFFSLAKKRRQNTIAEER